MADNDLVIVFKTEKGFSRSVLVKNGDKINIRAVMLIMSWIMDRYEQGDTLSEIEILKCINIACNEVIKTIKVIK